VSEETRTYEMSTSEMAARLGISERAVRFLLRNAISKLRAQPQLCARLRAAVKERRRMLDARPGNGPWHYAGPLQLSAQGGVKELL
jgi:hypothetical protein